MGRFMWITLALIVCFSGVAQASDEPMIPAEVGVFYFHGSQRCMSCRKMEEWTVLAVQSEFPDLLEDGSLQLEVINFHADGNEHIEKEFELDGPSVVLVSYQNNQIVKRKNLEKIWDLYDDQEKFEDYIVGETNSFLDIASERIE